MAEDDRIRWDARHSAALSGAEPDEPDIPSVFAPYRHLFPAVGTALDVACGQGSASVWLARRGLEVCGIDISGVALEGARRLTARYQVSDRCRFEPADLDLGLPPGPPADVVLCHLFRHESLYQPMAERVRDGGLLAVAVLSQVGAEPGPFRAGPGELRAAFAELSVLAEGEGGGRAWLLARR